MKNLILTEEGGYSGNCSDTFGSVVNSLQEIFRNLFANGTITSAYLVGSAACAVPKISIVSSYLCISSDVDIILFCSPTTLSLRSIEKLVRQAIDDRRWGWGIYRNIHVGYRIRPVSALTRTIVEYSSWGIDCRAGIRRLAGLALIENALRRGLIEEVPIDLLIQNVVSKLWFVVYSFPRKDLTVQPAGPDAVFLQQRLAAAAIKFEKLRVLASCGHYKDPEGYLPSFSRKAWKSDFLVADIRWLLHLGDAPSWTLDLHARRYAIGVLMNMARGVLKAMGIDVSRTGCELCSNHLRGVVGKWYFSVYCLSKALVDKRQSESLRALTDAVLFVMPRNCLYKKACLADGDSRGEIWNDVVEFLHVRQMPLISRNLLSYL